MSEQVMTPGAIQPAASRTTPAEIPHPYPCQRSASRRFGRRAWLRIRCICGQYLRNVGSHFGPRSRCFDQDDWINRIDFSCGLYDRHDRIWLPRRSHRPARHLGLFDNPLRYHHGVGRHLPQSLHLYIPSLPDRHRRCGGTGRGCALHRGDVSQKIPRARHRRHYVFALFGGLHFRRDMHDVHCPSIWLAMGIWLCDRPGHSGFRTPSDRPGIISLQARAGRNRETG